ncbi:hypothetical protein F4703DRAFT_1328412 [Phycomyces blakesleeanus]
MSVVVMRQRPKYLMLLSVNGTSFSLHVASSGNSKNINGRIQPNIGDAYSFFFVFFFLFFFSFSFSFVFVYVYRYIQ